MRKKDRMSFEKHGNGMAPTFCRPGEAPLTFLWQDPRGGGGGGAVQCWCCFTKYYDHYLNRFRQFNWSILSNHSQIYSRLMKRALDNSGGGGGGVNGWVVPHPTINDLKRENKLYQWGLLAKVQWKKGALLFPLFLPPSLYFPLKAGTRYCYYYYYYLYRAFPIRPKALTIKLKSN